MSDLVLDASLARQWSLEDEAERKYSLAVLSSLSNRRALVPLLWFYEVGNDLVMAHRRKRIRSSQVEGFLDRLKTLPIDGVERTASEILALPALPRTMTLRISSLLPEAICHWRQTTTRSAELRVQSDYNSFKQPERIRQEWACLAGGTSCEHCLPFSYLFCLPPLLPLRRTSLAIGMERLNPAARNFA